MANVIAKVRTLVVKTINLIADDGSDRRMTNVMASDEVYNKTLYLVHPKTLHDLLSLPSKSISVIAACLVVVSHESK